jgi:ABC-2 type transport system ATP-binding protein
MIEASGLTRRFGDFTAVSELTFEVGAGMILALLGPNGAGKTTTVRMLAALLAPSAGEAKVAGYDVRREPDSVRASVGLMTDAPGLYEQMNVVDYLNQFGVIYGLNRDQRRRRIDQLIEFFELAPYRSRRMVNFSKGMKQKVALARALIHEPPVLFLDEPTAGLDPLAARAVRELVYSLRQSRRAIILCTHDLDEAERLADKVAILRQGRIVALDAPAVLRSQAQAGALVRVELAAPCPAALDALRTVSGVDEPSWPEEHAASADRAAIVYCTQQPQVTNPLVVARLVALGAQVVTITCHTPSLEDVYASAVTSGGAPAEVGQNG